MQNSQDYLKRVNEVARQETNPCQLLTVILPPYRRKIIKYTNNNSVKRLGVNKSAEVEGEGRVRRTCSGREDDI